MKNSPYYCPGRGANPRPPAHPDFITSKKSHTLLVRPYAGIAGWIENIAIFWHTPPPPTFQVDITVQWKFAETFPEMYGLELFGTKFTTWNADCSVYVDMPVLIMAEQIIHVMAGEAVIPLVAVRLIPVSDSRQEDEHEVNVSAGQSSSAAKSLLGQVERLIEERQER